MTPSEIQQLQDFIRCARRGRAPGASSGEKAAYNLAVQAEEISDTMQSLDGEKQAGFLLLLRGLAWPDTRDMLLEKLPR